MKISNIYSRVKKPLLAIGVLVILSCADSSDEGDFLSFFQPVSSISDPSFYEYHFSPAFVYGSGDSYNRPWNDSLLESYDDNIKAWQVYLGNTLTAEVVAGGLYKKLDTTNAKKYQYRQKPKTGIGLEFLKVVEKMPHVKEYLEFAWNVEKFQTAASSWDDEVSHGDTSSLAKLFPTALRRAKSSKDRFIRERYAFQAIKIKGELQEYDEEIKLDHEFFGDSKSRSAISYWGECRAAGALLKRGDTAQALYHFAQVFEHSSSKRYAAYLSLRLYNILFDTAALAFCTSGAERSAVYAICAVQPWQGSLEILNGMVVANPRDSILRLVFAREINKTEYDLYWPTNSQYPWQDIDSLRRIRISESKPYAKKLLAFALQASRNPAIPDHAFWLMAAAHLEYMSDNFESSNDLLTQAENMPTTDSMQLDQMKLQKLLLFAQRTKVMTPEKEDEVMPMLEYFSNFARGTQHQHAFYDACMLIEKKYRQAVPQTIKGGFAGCVSGSTEASSEQHLALAKAFAFHVLASYYRPSSYYYERNERSVLVNDASPSGSVQAAINYYSQTDFRGYDKRLQKLTKITTSDLYLLKGTRSLAEHHYADARDAYTHVDSAYWKSDIYKTYLAANPFATQIIDTHAPTKADTLKYTPYQFTKIMSDLSQKLGSGGTPEQYYTMGCACYNMSAWGNSWLLIRSSWCGGDELGFYGWRGDSTVVDSAYLWTIEKAEEYFVLAMKHSKDREFAAQACWMAAKCEQKRFYDYRSDRYARINRDKRSYYYSDKPDSLENILLDEQRKLFRGYFNTMRTDYADTKFNQAARTECAYYELYAHGK